MRYSSDIFFGNTSFVQSMLKETNNTTRQSSSSKIIDSMNIHLWMLLPNPPDNIVNELQKTVFQLYGTENRTG